MPSREELGKALVECLEDVSVLLEHAYAVAKKQQEALVSSDAEAIALTTKAQEEVLRRISEADQRAAAVATQLAELAGLDPETAEPEAVTEAAGFPHSSLARRELARIPQLAERVRRANDVNHTLLENGLEVIACCLRTVASDPGASAYASDATLAGPPVSVLSLDQKV